MMPELGKYVFAVLGSYGISVAMLVVLCALSLMRARKMRRDLAVIEQRMRRDG